MEQNKNILAETAFRRLKGLWRFDRVIRGHGSMTGKAAFVENTPELLVYNENGIHALNAGEKLGFFQKYFYQFDDKGLFALFSDERPFHKLEFYADRNILKAAAMHLCGADQYRGEYVFQDDNNFSLTWDVRGPKKNYMIETRYSRQGIC